jgi:hypothetical protein
MKKILSIFLSAFILHPSALPAQTTPVLFPVNSLFGGAAYNKPLTITAANALVSDGQNLWAGTYTIIPASTTNPIVNLYPNTYLLTVAGVVRPARFVVPASTNILDVTTLITSGPLFYFGTNGMANLLAGTNIVFTTNADGSISISGAGGGTGGPITNASYATNAGTAQFANLAGVAATYAGSIGTAQITNLPTQFPVAAVTNAGNAAYGNTNSMKVAAATNADFATAAGSLIGWLALTNLPAAVLTNDEFGVTLHGTFIGDGTGLILPADVVTNEMTSDVTLLGGLYTAAAAFPASGPWTIGTLLHGDAGGGFGITGTPLAVDDFGNVSAASALVTSVTNGGGAYPGLGISDQTPANGNWNIYSGANGVLTLGRFGTFNNTNNGVKGTMDQVGNVSFRSFTGNGFGLTSVNARALVISNTISIYAHASGTNVFWSTVP